MGAESRKIIATIIFRRVEGFEDSMHAGLGMAVIHCRVGEDHLKFETVGAVEKRQPTIFFHS
jgi:hypothetical protein